MDPSSLVTPRLVNFCKNKKAIVVCGYTKTGKVKIARKLAEELNYPLFISDDYIQEEDRVESLYKLIDDILPYYNQGKPFIVEGILCFRLLRKGVQLGNFYSDFIIKTECSDRTIQYFYDQDGESHKIKRALSFNKGLNTIWEEYLDLMAINRIPPPEFLRLNTSLPGF